VLGEIALRDIDLTAAANASPAADRIEIDAKPARGGEQAQAFGELATLTGGREDDAMGQEINRSKVFQSSVGWVVLSRPQKRPSREAARSETSSGHPGPPLSRG
jgi:hypothetical protein